MQDFITYYLYNNYLACIDQFVIRQDLLSFLEIMYNGMPDMVNNVFAQIDFEAWIYNVGPDPTGSLNFNNALAQPAIDLANAYIALNGASSPANWDIYLDFTSNQ
jgi:hypothetical protein